MSGSWLREQRFTVEVLLELVIIVLIGLELWIGWKAIDAAKDETRLLQSLLSQSGAQAKALETIGDEQAKSLNSVVAMNKLLKDQLDILAAEQKQRLAELEQKPRLQLFVKGIPLSQSSAREVPLNRITPSEAVMELTMRNYGSLYAQDVQVLASTDKPYVDLQCAFAGGPTVGGTVAQQNGKQCSFKVNFIGHDWNENATVKASYPIGSPAFTVDFTMWATNYPKRRIGAIPVKPPAR